MKLVKTCDACPEQYDVINPDTKIMLGYIRFRWGRFSVQCPDVGGDTVLEAYFGHTRGILDQEERDVWLPKALLAIEKWHEKGKP